VHPRPDSRIDQLDPIEARAGERLGGRGTARDPAAELCDGQSRSMMIGYFEDGPNLVSMAMNSWGAAEAAWWPNLQASLPSAP
jgi:hypothetical protein